MMDTVYVPVEANSVTARAVIPSDADTTNGYYLAYEVSVGEGGGFTGISWCLDATNDPFQGYSGITNAQDIVDYYNAHGNLNDIFATWLSRVGERQVSAFCSGLMDNDAYYYAGCITMTSKH